MSAWLFRSEFRMPRDAGRWRGAGIAAGRQGTGIRRRALRRRPGGPEHLHRHRRPPMTTCGRPCAACIARIPTARILVTGCYAQRAPEELAALPGVEWVVGNSHKTQIAELVIERALSRQHPRRRYFRAARFSLRAGGGRRRRPHPPQSQDPGRLQQSLLVLHHSVRARPQPQRAGRAGGGAGAQPGAQVSRSGAERHQPGPLGPGTGQHACAWPICCGGCSPRPTIERLRLSSVEPMDFSDDLLGLMAASPRIAKHVHAPLQSGSRSRAAPHASQVPAAPLCRPHPQGARPDAGCRHRRRRDDGLPRRDRRRVRREPRASSRACRSPTCTSSRIRSGRARRPPSRRTRCRCACARSATASCANWPRRRIWNSASAWWDERSRW